MVSAKLNCVLRFLSCFLNFYLGESHFESIAYAIELSRPELSKICSYIFYGNSSAADRNNHKTKCYIQLCSAEISKMEDFRFSILNIMELQVL